MKKITKRFLTSLMVAVMIITVMPLNEFSGLNLNLDWFGVTSKSFAAEMMINKDNDETLKSKDISFAISDEDKDYQKTGESYNSYFSQIENMAAGYENIADNFNLDDYLADYYLRSPTINYINNGMETMTVAPGFIENLENNIVFISAYATWEVSTFIENPISTVENLLDRKLYYETILFRLLDAMVNSDNVIDWLNQGAIKYSLKFCKYLTTATEIDYRYDVAKTANLLDLSDIDRAYFSSVSTGFIKGQGYKKLGNDIGFVNNALSLSKSIEEFSERLGSYLQLAYLSESIIYFLQTVKEHAENDLVEEAIDMVLNVSSESFDDFMKDVVFDGATTIGTTALKNYFGKKWKEILLSKLTSGVLSTGYSFLNGALLANSIGRTVSDICFSTNKKLDHYELMKALVATESSIKKAVNSILNTETSGAVISKGIEFLYKMYSLDCDLCLELVDIMDSDWIQLSTTAERNNAKSNINTVKNFFTTQYSKIMPQSGACGKNLFWIFDNITEALLIYGIGEMNDYAKGQAPWYSFKDRIRSLHISSYCWEIGANSFCDFTNLNAPLILQDYISDNITYGSGCFDSLNPNTCIIFTENANVASLNVECPIYVLNSIRFTSGSSSISEIYVNEQLYASSTLNVNKNGVLTTNELKISGGLLVAKEFANLEIYENFDIVGRDHQLNNNGTIYYDAMKLYNGTTVNIHGDAHFCSGYFYAYSGSIIYVSGDCIIDGGGISQGTYYYCYGDFIINGNLKVKAGYCSSSGLHLYGKLKTMDIENVAGQGGYHGFTFVYGSLYIEKDDMEHNLNRICPYSSNSYISVKGNANNFLDEVNYDCQGTVEFFGDALLGWNGGHGKTISLVFSGNNKQKFGFESRYRTDSPRQFDLGTIIINNDKGVEFTCQINSIKLFNHKGNPFWIDNKNSTFVDYDDDGLKDNIDPYPVDSYNGRKDYIIEPKGSLLTVDNETMLISEFINGIDDLYSGLKIPKGSTSTISFDKNVEKVYTGMPIQVIDKNGNVLSNYSAVIIGDVTGDGNYDGMDSIIVSSLVSGILTETDVSKAVYMAADCNHDGQITQSDIDLLTFSGVYKYDVRQVSSEKSQKADVLFANEFDFDSFSFSYSCYGGQIEDIDYENNSVIIKSESDDCYMNPWYGADNSMNLIPGHKYRIKYTAENLSDSLAIPSVLLFARNSEDSTDIDNIEYMFTELDAGQKTVFEKLYTVPENRPFVKVRLGNGAPSTVRISDIEIQDITNPYNTEETFSLPNIYGKECSIVTVNKGTSFSDFSEFLPQIYNNGYYISGWYTEKDSNGNGDGKLFSCGQAITTNIKLYPRWEKI